MAPLRATTAAVTTRRVALVRYFTANLSCVNDSDLPKNCKNVLLLPHASNFLFLALFVTFLFVFCVFVYEIYREPLNRFARNSQEDVFGPSLGRV